MAARGAREGLWLEQSIHLTRCLRTLRARLRAKGPGQGNLEQSVMHKIEDSENRGRASFVNGQANAHCPSKTNSALVSLSVSHVATSALTNTCSSRCDPFRVAGAPEAGCRFAAAGPNNVRQTNTIDQITCRSAQSLHLLPCAHGPSRAASSMLP